MKISICIPVYNGEKTIEDLVNVLIKEFEKDDLEIVLVNDGSKDSSEEVCERLAMEKSEVKFISLRRNFGEHNAVICALNYVTGDYAAIIDDDFQNMPGEIKKLLAIAPDHDVVYSRYLQKKHHWFRNLGSAFNNYVANHLLNKPKDLYLSSFKVIKKEVVDEIIKYKGPFPYIDGLILRVTNSIGVVKVEHSERKEGKSGYTLSKLISLWLNMFINFSIKPMRMFTVFGVFLFALGLGFSILFVVEKIMDPSISVGWTSIIISVLLLSGVQLVFLGMIGEYLGKQYLDQNGTPQWTVKKEIL